MRNSACLAALALAVAGCRSPFAAPEATGPDAAKVGRGVHGWPLYESTPHGDGWRTDVLWPAWSSVRTGGDGLNSTDVLFPLFHVANEGARHRTGLLRPLFDLETEGDERYDLDILWPLVKWVDAPDHSVRRVAPLYACEERPGYSLRTLLPFHMTERRGTEETTWYVPPLLGVTTDETEDVATWSAALLTGGGHEGDTSRAYALPLFWHDASPRERHDVITPLWWDFETRTSSFRMLVPFYGRYRSDDGDETTAIGGPLYVGGKDGDTEFTWLAAPFVHWSTSPDSWNAHLFPVLWAGREGEDRGYTHVWPLFGWKWRGDDERVAHVAAPFLRYGWDATSWELDLPWPLVHFESRENGGETRLWPLFDHERRDDHVEGNVLLWLSTWESRGEDDRDFRILFRLVESTRRSGRETFVVNPLFRHERNDAGDTYWSFLFGLVARREEAGEVDWRLLWFL